MAATEYDFEFTRNQVIERALRIVGVLSQGETPNAYQISQGKVALNALVKAWQTEHIFLWTLTTASITTIVDTVSYSLGSDPSIIAIDRAYDASGTPAEFPIQVISYREYNDVLRKTTTSGSTYAIAIDNHEQTPTAYIWPAPTTVFTINLLVIRRLKDMDAGSDNPDMPQRFQDALCYGLADHLSDEYGLPLPERQRIGGKYREMFERAKASDWERKDVEFVEPAY